VLTALAFAGISLAVLAVGAFVVRDLRRTQDDVRGMYAGAVRGLDLIGDLQFHTQEARRSVLYALTTTDANLQVQYADQSRAADARVAEILRTYGDLPLAARSAQVLRTFETGWAAYRPVRDEVLASILEGSVGEAVERDLRDGVPAFERVREDLDALKRNWREDAEARLEAVEASSQRSVLRLVAILCLMQLLTVGYARAGHRAARAAQASEAALRETKDLLAAVLDHSPSVIYAKDSAGRYLFVNRQFEAAYHVTREDIAGKTDHDHFPREQADAYRANDRAVWGSGTAMEFLESAPHDDGLHSYVSTKFPLRDARGAITVVCGISVDVTERQRTEAALRMAQKMEAVGLLAGGVAHDFNNLLTVITGYSHLLLRDLGPGHPGRGRVDEIVKAADRAAALTRQLLAFGRKQVLQPRIIPLNAVVVGVEPMLQRLIGEQIQVRSRLEARGRVTADPGQMEQVIVNLAVNARDAMSEGGVLTIETADVELDESFVRTNPGAQPGPHVMLAVSDAGHGMDRETLSHIFEPFFTTKAAGQGTGLGLATVYGIVKQSGGYIAASSELGRGATFRVYLPRVGQEEEPAHAASAPPEPRAAGSESILVVEDEEALREIVCEVLEADGYTVLAGANPDEALAAAAGHPGPIHLLLTDVVMPGRSGPEVARALRALRPEARVLYMSGYTGEAISGHGVLDLDAPLLQKPFTADGLLRSVREALTGPPGGVRLREGEVRGEGYLRR